jgi:DNA polymerase-3 subunit gamma/tau
MTLLRMLAFTPNDSNKATQQISQQTVQKAPPVQLKPLNLAEVKQTVTPTIEVMTTAQNATFLEPKATHIKNDSQEASSALTSKGLDFSRTNSVLQFDGDWRKLVEQNLKLGLARALAQNCELVSYDDNSLTLRVASNQKHLAAANYQEKLSIAINEYFGKKIRLNFEINKDADAEIITPAKQIASEKAIVQSGAEAAIMQDTFVQALIQNFDAAIIPNSIKPIQ